MRASHRSACSVTEQEVLAREKKSVAFTVTFVPHVHTCVCMSVCRRSLSVDSSSRGRVISATTEDFSRKQHAEHPVSCPLIAEVSVPQTWSGQLVCSLDLRWFPHVWKHSYSVLKRLALPPQPPYQNREHAPTFVSKNQAVAYFLHWLPISAGS